MNLYRIDIIPKGGFYTPIKGDTLFGSFCWSVVETFGEERLIKLLDGYTETRPYAVFSDAVPDGFLPKPALSALFFKSETDKEELDAKKRKEFKRKNWIKKENIDLPTTQMTFEHDKNVKFIRTDLRTSNHVNPETNHVDGGRFSAFTQEQHTYLGKLNLYVLIDESKITIQETEQLLTQIGQTGFGKKASSGNGKFTVEGVFAERFKASENANAFMTLAPVVPAPNVFDKDKSFYRTFVRFGRHGNQLALSDKPFKKPVLTMDTGAVLTPKGGFDKTAGFVGTGVKDVSLESQNTVFQGYAPVVPLYVKEGL